MVSGSAGSTITLLLVTTLVPTALHPLLRVLACVLHLFGSRTLVSFLRDPFRGTVEKGNYIDALRAALWLGFNLVVSVGLTAAVGYALIGVRHLPVAKWLHNLVAWAYGV